MNSRSLRLFSLNDSKALGARISRALGVALSPHEEREFEDGEHKSRPLCSVRDADVFVVQSLHGDDRHSANDKLCRLLFFIGALRDASAGRVSVLCPYLCYSRKDRKTKSRDPVTTRYVAALFEAVGTHLVVTMDVHNLAAFQNAFRCRTEHLTALELFAAHFSSLVGDEDCVVVSPDAGGYKRAQDFRERLSGSLGRPVDLAFMEKKRSSGVVTGETVVGRVEGKSVIIVDDLISTGTTLSRAVEACHALGATRICAAATHGLFQEGASHFLSHPHLKEVAVTDTAAPFRLEPELLSSRLAQLETAPLFAEAIRAIHEGGSIVELLAPDSAVPRLER